MIDENINEIIARIDNKKNAILLAITKAIHGDNSQNLDDMIAYYEEKIRKINIFIYKPSQYKSGYVEKISFLLKDISNLIGKEVELNLFGKYDEKQELNNKYNLSYDNYLKCKKLFNTYNKLYSKVGILFEDVLQLCDKQGLDGLEKLYSLTQILNKNVYFYNLKEGIISHKEFLMYSNMVLSELFSIVEKCNVRSIKDFEDLYSEVNSFFVDENKIIDEERKALEMYRNRFRKRMGVDSNFIFNKKEIHKLLKRINFILSNNYYKYNVSKANVDDFFVRYGYNFNKENLKNLLYVLYSLKDTILGQNAFIEFDSEIHNLITLQYSILEKKSKIQNEVIIHEYVHGLEVSTGEFSKMYPLWSEAVNQYITKKALKYLEYNILNDDRAEYICGEETMAYDCMLPLVERLEKSLIWNDVLYSKNMQEPLFLEERIGTSNVKKINRCFESVFKNHNYQGYIVEFDKYEFEAIEKIINDIEKNNKRYQR